MGNHFITLRNLEFVFVISQLQEEHKTTERRAIVLEKTVTRSPMHKDVYSANSQQVYVCCALRLFFIYRVL